MHYPMNQLDSPAEAQRAALQYLKKGPLSVGQIRQRLLNRGFEKVAAENAIENLIECGDLSDRNLAMSLSEQAIHNGRGPRWIEQALSRRLFIDEDIEFCVDQAKAQAEEIAQTILRKRYGPVALAEAATRPKAARFLHGRGFEENTIEDALEAVFPVPEY